MPAYPVAPTAEAALHAPEGLAERREAAVRLADGPVVFASEAVGPAFRTREAAEEAYAARLSSPWCALRPVAEEGRPPAPPARPLTAGGRRWPEPTPAAVLWRLEVSWWRSSPGDEAAGAPLPPARRARKHASGAELDGRALGRLAVQPLRAVRPQQPLDIGLFEVRPPEAPERLIADE